MTAKTLPRPARLPVRDRSRAVQLLCLLALLIPPVSAATLSGMPPVERFVAEVEVFPQHFAVARAPDGMIFGGGVDGIVTFDGERWDLSPMPNGRLVRSLAHDGAARLYVGGYDQFGYLEHDASGAPVFTDLSSRITAELDGEPFADIWRILITGDVVFFRGVQHLFRYRVEDDALDLWHHAGRFGAIVEHDGATLLQFRGVGLKRLLGDDFELVPIDEDLTEQLYALLPLPNGRLLGFGRDGRWLEIGGRTARLRSMPEVLGDSAHFASYLALPDGSMALGGREGTLYFYDPQSDRVDGFRISTDRLSDLVPAPGGLLAQTDTETIYVRWPSPWRRIERGLMGAVRGIASWEDSPIAWSSAGVARLAAGRSDLEQQFEDLGWTGFEAWDWLALEPGRGLLATSYAVVEVTAAGTQPITHGSLYPRRFLPGRYHEDRIYVGTELGLAVLLRQNGDWELGMAAETLTARVTSLLEIGPGELLLGTSAHGLIRAGVSADGRGLERWEDLSAQLGLDPDGAEAAVSMLHDGTIIVSTEQGFHRWQDGALEAADLGGLNALREAGELLELVPDGSTGELWAYSPRRVLKRSPAGEWRDQNIESLRRGAINSLDPVGDGRVFVGAGSSLLLYESDHEAAAPQPPEVVLRSVIRRDPDGHEVRLPLHGGELPQQLSGADAVIFEFALPELARPASVNYQARLLGFEADFSPWATSSRVTYSRLAPGNYRFEVRARDSQGRISSAGPFEFSVAPPWYQAWWALAVWTVVGLALLAVLLLAVMRWRTQRLEAERRRLTEMVGRRTRELAQANHQLQAMAHQDGLTGIANRRRLDRYLEEAARLCRAEDRVRAILLIDVDHFKEYNDQHGHVAADTVLRELAQLIAGRLRRAEDLVARYGGEEFAVVMPGAGIELAEDLAHALRRAVAEAPFGVTVSIGLAAGVPADGREGYRPLLDQADQALYRAKSAGRDQVRVANEE